MKKASGFARNGNVSFNFLADEQSVEKDEYEFKILTGGKAVKKTTEKKYFALYGQYGSGLILSSDISEKEVVPEKERRNFAILCSNEKNSLEYQLPRNQEYLLKNGVVIIRSDIPNDIWY